MPSYIPETLVNRFAILKISSIILALMLATFSITTAFADPSRAPELETITFIDVLRPANVEGHVEGEACASSSSTFKTIRGGIRWRKESAVTYSVDTSGLVGLTVEPLAAGAVLRAAESWDALDEGTFFDNVALSTPNVDVTVSWAPLDGPGGTLAVTGLSFNPATKTIVSASITFDSLDQWEVYPSIDCGEQFVGQDVENVGAHEFGHVIGTDHVNDDVDLTMYKFITQPGETRKRTLGIGDIAGFRALYIPGGDPPTEDPPEDDFCPPGHARRNLC